MKEEKFAVKMLKFNFKYFPQKWKFGRVAEVQEESSLHPIQLDKLCKIKSVYISEKMGTHRKLIKEFH